MARTPVPIPPNEAQRLRNLEQYRILDSGREADFDDITALASHICGTSISLITMVDEDRQWFKSARGLEGDMTETPREDAFCAYNILDPSAPLVVPDARLDPRFADNPLVTGEPKITFYAGTPLISSEGYALGSLCVIDQREMGLNGQQLDALERLGRQVVKLIELRQSLAVAEVRHQKLSQAHETLKDFSHIIAHDLKAPLRNIRSYSEILREDYAHLLPADGNELLRGMEALVGEARLMIEGVLRYSSALNDFGEAEEILDLGTLVMAVGKRIGLPDDCSLVFAGPQREILAARTPLEQILQNLIGNAVKFRDKPRTEIRVNCQWLEEGVRISVKDNGRGFSQKMEKTLFTMFYTTADGANCDSHGVGLNIVKRLVEMMGGKLEVASEPGVGSEIGFVLTSA
jgi:hypothetical protein